jgi:hypothetical protein
MPRPGLAADVACPIGVLEVTTTDLALAGRLPTRMSVEQRRARGDLEAAERADRELGEKVDTDQDAARLAELNVDAGRLEDDFGGQAPAVG